MKWRPLRTTNCPLSCLGTPTGDGLRKRWTVKRPDAYKTAPSTGEDRLVSCIRRNQSGGPRWGFICLLSDAANLPSTRSYSDVAFAFQLSLWERRLQLETPSPIMRLIAYILVRTAWRQRPKPSSSGALHKEPRRTHVHGPPSHTWRRNL